MQSVNKRREILSQLSDGAVHDLYAKISSRPQTSMAASMLIAFRQIDVVDHDGGHLWARITDAGRKALRQRDG